LSIFFLLPTTYILPSLPTILVTHYCCHHTSFHLFCQQFFKQHTYQR
jgi:hypothetical protein